MSTLQEQIEQLKVRIAELEAQVGQETKNESAQLKFIRTEGLHKIDELINGYPVDDESGTYTDYPIDWEFCSTVGKYAKYNIECDGDEYIWPYRDAEVLKNDAEQLLNDALSGCIQCAKDGTDGTEYPDCWSYTYRVASGRFNCSCHINLPKDPDSTELEDGTRLVWFDAFVELDGMIEW